MKVSELARATGVSVHRLRRYEEMGLLQATRGPSGYREFEARTVREVIFVSMSRELGFALADVSALLPRYRSGTLSLDELREVLQKRVAEVDAQIAQGKQMRKKLVKHIAWVGQREKRARGKPPARRVQSAFELAPKTAR